MLKSGGDKGAIWTYAISGKTIKIAVDMHIEVSTNPVRWFSYFFIIDGSPTHGLDR